MTSRPQPVHRRRKSAPTRSTSQSFAVDNLVVDGYIENHTSSAQLILPTSGGTLARLEDLSIANLYVVVSTLPTASASTMGKIYLIPSAHSVTQNTKDEYITIRSGSEGSYTYSWEQIGSTETDLSNYWQNSNSGASNYLVAMTTGTSSDAASATGTLYAMLNYYFPVAA